MSDEFGSGLITWLDAMLGGAATTVVAAVVARLAYHGQQVRQQSRRIFGVELLFELPIAIGMALVGDALASYLSVSHTASIGVVAALAYLGPRGAQALLDRWLGVKPGDKQ